MVAARTAGDFMVRSPTVALPWQPLSMIRQVMLSNSYSYLPVRLNPSEDWRLVSDVALARFLRCAKGSDERNFRMSMKLKDAVEASQVALDKPACVAVTTPIDQFLGSLGALPLLVLDEREELIGIVTAFDLL